MECLFPKKENEEEKKHWLEERRNIRKYNARLNAILYELEDYLMYIDSAPRVLPLAHQQNVVMV